MNNERLPQEIDGTSGLRTAPQLPRPRPDICKGTLPEVWNGKTIAQQRRGICGVLLEQVQLVELTHEAAETVRLDRPAELLLECRPH